MKKFLTVLLALSVVFTYTVGTAFAATPSEFNANVNSAEAQVMTALTNSYNAVVNTVVEKKAGEVEAGKDAWKAAAKDTYDKLVLAVKAETNTIKADDANKDKSVNDIIKLYHTKVTYTDVWDETYLNVDVAARYQFNVAKAAALAKINTVDLSVYSTTEKEIGGVKTSYNALAKAELEKMIKAVNAVTIKADADAAAVKAALGDIATAINNIEEILKDGKGTGVYKLVASLNLKTIADENSAAVTLEAKKAAKLSEMNSAAATYYVGIASLTGTELTEAIAVKDAFVTVYTYIINAATTTDDVDKIVVPALNKADTFYAKNIATIQELEVYAAKYKAEKDADGNFVRDAKKVDAIVATAKLDAYKAAAPWTGLTTAQNDIKTKCNADAAVNNYNKEVKKAKAIADKEAALKNYFEKEQAAVIALYDAYIAKIEAATTDAELTAAKLDDVALGKVLNKVAVVGLYTGDTATGTAFTALKTKLDLYAQMMNAGLVVTSDNYKDVKLAFADDAALKNFVAEKGARTATEIAAVYADATAKLDAVKTVAQLKSEKANVEALIAALPGTITLADKDKVTAAWEAKNAYGKNDIANEATLNLAVRALASLEKKAVEDTVKALPAEAKVTVADKEAVKAAAKAIKEFNDKVAAEKIYAGLETAVATTTTDDLLKAIKTIELNNVVAAINALPLNIDIADKAAVEAARAAYDAYVAEYTDYAKNIDARADINNKGDLFKAEAALKVATDKENEAAKLALKEMSLKASSTVGKGYIKVTVKGGDSKYVDGYQVFRSTKKYSGFGTKAKFDTKSATKTTYKNTAVKAGKKYYYKVRAYKVIDGKKYYSAWSTKAWRTAK